MYQVGGVNGIPIFSVWYYHPHSKHCKQ